jgi:CheY-like chemotaxis protein
MKRVLVVDDNPLNLRLVGMLLESFGCEWASACDSSRALDMAREFRPEVALLDIHMPGIDGIELGRQLRRELGEFPMYALTAAFPDVIKGDIDKAGFTGLIRKPCDMETLRRAVS